MSGLALRTFVAVVSTQDLIRTGVRALIEREPDMEVVFEAVALPDASMLPSCALVMVVDLALVLSAADAGRRIQGVMRDCGQRAKLIALSLANVTGGLRQALAIGAQGYLGAGTPGSELLTAVRTVASGRVYINADAADDRLADLAPPTTAGRGAEESPARPLSQREQQVLALFALGRNNQQIADTLGVRVKTVETYRSRLTHKLRTRTRAELVARAHQLGIARAAHDARP